MYTINYISTREGDLLNNVINKFIDGKYSDDIMNEAVLNFIKGSGANMDGRYNGYKNFSNKKAVSLLQKYLRLKEL